MEIPLRLDFFPLACPLIGRPGADCVLDPLKSRHDVFDLGLDRALLALLDEE
jgi:hypothetical protein